MAAMELSTDERWLVCALAKPRRALQLVGSRGLELTLFTLIDNPNYKYFGHARTPVCEEEATLDTVDRLVARGCVYRRPSNCLGWANEDIATLVDHEQLPEDVRLVLIQTGLGGL